MNKKSPIWCPECKQWITQANFAAHGPGRCSNKTCPDNTNGRRLPPKVPDKSIGANESWDDYGKDGQWW